MSTTKVMDRGRKPDKAYIVLGLLAFVYLLVVLFLMPGADTLQRYNLTIPEARALRLALIVPYMVIWFVAFFGYVKIKHYSQIISSSNDGASLGLMAKGLLVLALGMPVIAIINSLTTYVSSHHPAWTKTFVLINSYTDILIGIIAMTLLHKGARSLAKYVDRGIAKKPSYVVSIVITIMGSAFVGLMLNSSTQSTELNSTHIAQNLPVALLVITVIFPLIFIWYNGLLAAHYVLIYRRYIYGAIYRSALGYLAGGIVFVILARITLRYLSSISAVFSTWTLRYVLIALYVFLFMMALGFGLIAKGAKKLTKLEEV